MRLEKVATGHRFKERMLLGFIRLVSGAEPEDVVKTLCYRPGFFRRWHDRLTLTIRRHRFDVYDRCADGLGRIVRGHDALVRDARFLLKRGCEPGAPREPPAAQRAQLEAAVLDGPGVTAPALRRAAAGGPAGLRRAGRDLPAGVSALAADTRDHADLVTDEAVAALRAEHGDDALLELVVAVAVGAAAVRADAGLAAPRAQAAA